MGRFQDLTGQRFARLVVIGRDANRGAKVVWRCKCDCGKIVAARASDLTLGKHRSCGCLQIESVTTHNYTSEGVIMREYRIWTAMRQRCNNPKNTHYERYGGRGIKVCDRWNSSFENFIADMGYTPTPLHTLDRVNNDGNYEPSNCKWATRKEQAQNRTNNPKSYDSSRKRDKLGQFK